MRIGTKLTSVALEPAFWIELSELPNRGRDHELLFERVRRERACNSTLASALRVFALESRLPRALGQFVPQRSA